MKRLLEAQGDLEFWREDPSELYPFNKMNAALLKALAIELGLTFDRIPERDLTPEAVLTIFKAATPKPAVVTILKSRQTRVVAAHVVVERADIKMVRFDGAPVSIARPLISVGLENDRDLTGAPRPEIIEAKQEVEAAVSALTLRNQPLKAMNYLEAIEALMPQ